MHQSLERIIPGAVNNDSFEAETLALHLERYRYAGRLLKRGNIADVACGVGYGSYMLATEFGDKINKIVAADIEEAAILFAKKNYHHQKIRFIISNVFQLNFSEQMDTIVSLETIEHLPDPLLFIQQMKKQLSIGGRFIVSVPITPSMDANPFHLHDFTAKKFRRIFEENDFKEIDSLVQIQSYQPFSEFNRKSDRTNGIRKNLLKYYLRHPGKLFLRLRSMLVDGFKNKYLVVVFEKL